MSSKRQFSAKDLVELLNPAPVNKDYDPEDIDFGTEKAVVAKGDSAEVTTRKSRLRDGADLEALSEQYGGQRVSRANLQGSDDSSDEEDESEGDSASIDDHEANGAANGHVTTVSAKSDSDSDMDEDEEDEESVPRGQSALAEQLEELEEEEQASFFKSRTDIQQEIEKANHVKNQRFLYERGLNTRIRLQGVMNLANRLPQGEALHAFSAQNAEVAELLRTVQGSLGALTADILEVQRQLMLANEHVPDPPSSSSSHGSESDSDSGAGADLDSLWKTISAQSAALQGFENDTIEKWNRRTQLISGAKAMKASGFKAINQSVLTQIRSRLSEKDELIKRSQLKRSDYTVIGQPKRKFDPSTALSGDYDEEIYDDADFYQQMLRDVLSGGGDFDNELAVKVKRVKKKARKNVDRRASKGRKLRYTVQPKIVNFMAPIVKHDESFIADELFANLFGQGIGTTSAK